MSASEQANAFCREVLVSGEDFLVEHETDGVVTWPLAGSYSARPVWSSRRRAARMLDGPLAAPGLVIVRCTWDEYRDVIIPEIEQEGLLVGLNWSGPRARGYNLPPADVIARVDAARAESSGTGADPSPPAGDTPDSQGTGDETGRRAG